MDIPNLNQAEPIPEVKAKQSIINIYVLMTIITGIFFGFWLSRFFPSIKRSGPISSLNQSKSEGSKNENVISIDSSDNIKIEVGKVYGNSSSTFSDTATGTIEKGNINNIGTHILKRDGGKSQWASLTSSVLDLDLFVGHKVEVSGETNSSDKTGWLMDVGKVKVIE